MAKKHSKRYSSGLKVADLAKDYPLKDAVEILSKFPKAKFDETVELSFRLGVDAASGEQNVRGTTPLPNGSGKKVRVLVFTDDPQKAIAAGADVVMIGSLFAGAEESPGEVFLYQGRSFKAYRGMGSVGAMTAGSATRYFQGDVKDQLKLVPEGIEGQVPYRGPIAPILYQLAGGLRASMGYVGAPTISQFQDRAQFVRITNAGLRESHVHDVTITRESPNYPTGV